MRFENESNLSREQKAIEKFCSKFKFTFKKLGPNDIDFQVFDSNEELRCFVEVKGRHRMMKDAYPLPVAVRKLHKLQGDVVPRQNPVIIWACDDGIIYGRIEKLNGEIRFGGRKKREGSTNDVELMAYYDKQKDLHHEQY